MGFDLDRERLVTTYKATCIALAGFCLSIAHIPTVVPASDAFLLGILCNVLAVCLPKLYCAVPVAALCAYAYVLTVLAYETVLLAAATVSDGLYLGVFALSAFYIQGLYFGPNCDRTNTAEKLILGLGALLSLSLRELVQDGFFFSVDVSSFYDELVDALRPLLVAVCAQEGLPADCWEDSLPNVSQPIQILIPSDSDSFLSGQTALISPGDDGKLDIRVPGGMWVVRGLWSWQGLGNAMAIHRNLLIVVSWGLAITALGIYFLPPCGNTVRKLLTRTLVPYMANLMVDMVQESQQHDGNGNEEQEKCHLQKRATMVHLLNVISGGGPAGLTIFEPRIFNHPFEFIMPHLKQLLVDLEQSVYTFCFVGSWKENAMQEDELKETIRAWRVCAKALASNSVEVIESLKEHSSSVENEIYRRVNRFRGASVTWLKALNDPFPIETSDKIKNLSKRYVIWILSPFLPHKRLFEVWLLIFNPNQWRAESVLWSLKRVAGYVVLIAMSVFWGNYADFAITTHSNNVGPVYSGWHLLSYAFAFSATPEGTFHVGVMRLAGTALGGFAAWLGLIVCSGSYDDDAEINPYALVAWLTVTSSIVAFVSFDSGLGAQMGLNADHGKIGMYFVTVQSLIALEAFYGKGSRDELTVNRITATGTGVAMAVFVAILPPNKYGGDPSHTLAYLRSLQTAFLAILRDLTTCEGREHIGDSDTHYDELIQEAESKRKIAMFLIKDASAMHVIPLFRVNAALKPLLEDMAVSESYLREVAELSHQALAAGVVIKGNGNLEELKKCLHECESAWEVSNHKLEEPEVESGHSDSQQALEGGNELTSLLLSVVRATTTRLDRHKTDLNSL